AAHSTVLSSRTMQLSRDWPGVLVDSLDRGRGNFALYLAGAVGSMAPRSHGKDDLEEMADQGAGVFRTLKTAQTDTKLARLMRKAVSAPHPLGAPEPRRAPRCALRSWVFKSAFGDFPSDIKALRIGNVLMVGVPCDFSGELLAPLDR